MAKRKLEISLEFPCNYPEIDQQKCQIIYKYIRFNMMQKYITYDNSGCRCKYRSPTEIKDEYTGNINLNMDKLLKENLINNNSKCMLELIKIDLTMFDKISDELKIDSEFILKCIEIDKEICSKINIQLLDDINFVLDMIEKDPELLKFASKSIQLLCCEKNKNLQQYVSADIKKNDFNKLDNRIANIK